MNDESSSVGGVSDNKLITGLRSQLIATAGDTNEYAADPPLPFRPLVHELVWHEAEAEAFELCMHYLLFSSFSLDIARQITHDFVSTLSESILPRKYDPKYANNELQGDSFTKSIVRKLRQFLAEVATPENQAKLAAYINNSRTKHDLELSLACQKNQRRSNEDRHVALRRVNEVCTENAALCSDANWFQAPESDSLFCVFDGHGGTEIANYCATHVPWHFTRAAKKCTDLGQSLRDTFKSLETSIEEKCAREKIRSGCTAVICVLREGQMCLGWAGDSHAVVMGSKQSRTLTTGHSLDVESEYERIEAAGGTCLNVQGELRVNGVFNLTRAMGDVSMKPLIISEPEILEFAWNPDDHILVLCCDGVWDSMDDDMYVDTLQAFCKHKTKDEWMQGDYDRFSEVLCSRAKANGAADNLTCVVVYMKPLDDIWHMYAD